MLGKLNNNEQSSLPLHLLSSLFTTLLSIFYADQTFKPIILSSIFTHKKIRENRIHPPNPRLIAITKTSPHFPHNYADSQPLIPSLL
jgi:hypothetical protein